MINTKYSILNSGYVGAVEVTFIAITMGIQTSISWYRWPPIAAPQASHQKSDDLMHENMYCIDSYDNVCVCLYGLLDDPKKWMDGWMDGWMDVCLVDRCVYIYT